MKPLGEKDAELIVDEVLDCCGAAPLDECEWCPLKVGWNDTSCAAVVMELARHPERFGIEHHKLQRVGGCDA